MRLLLALLTFAGVAQGAPLTLESAQISAARLRPAQLAPAPQDLIERLSDSDPYTVARALKAMTPAAKLDARVEGAIADYAEDGNKPVFLRALAWKSLYDAAANAAARALLLAQLGDANADPALREGAAWALFQDSGRSAETRMALMTTALDLGEPEALRLEALKSLYSGMASWDARDGVLELAQDAGAPERLRACAVLLLHAVRADWKVQPVLEQLWTDPSPAIRRAAELAATPGTAPELAAYFHLTGFESKGQWPASMATGQ